MTHMRCTFLHHFSNPTTRFEALFLEAPLGINLSPPPSEISSSRIYSSTRPSERQRTQWELLMRVMLMRLDLEEEEGGTGEVLVQVPTEVLTLIVSMLLVTRLPAGTVSERGTTMVPNVLSSNSDNVCSGRGGTSVVEAEVEEEMKVS